ncbi:MAG: hypothetical protein ACK5AL_13600 [Planctomycetota bacterium]
MRPRTSSASSIPSAPTPCARIAAASVGARSLPTSASNLQNSWTSARQLAWEGIARLLEQVVRPVFADLPAADVDLWIAAKVEGLGWQAAGEAAGMGRAAIRRSRQRILRFLSTGDVLRRLKQRLDDVP